jgi:hypothetical protein
MAETTQSAERQREEAAQKIAVTNMYRDQPILFHVIGGSVRLGPLETRELDRDCLASPEVSHLVGAGVLRVREAEEQNTEGQDDVVQRKSSAAREPRSAAGRRKERTEDERHDPQR